MISVLLTSLARLLCMIAGGISLAIALFLGDYADAAHILGILLSALWVISPYVYLYRVLASSAASTAVALVWFLATLAIGGFGLAAYFDAFFLGAPEPQSPVLLLVAPVYQWLMAGLFTLVQRFVARVAGR